MIGNDMDSRKYFTIKIPDMMYTKKCNTEVLKLMCCNSKIVLRL